MSLAFSTATDISRISCKYDRTFSQSRRPHRARWHCALVAVAGATGGVGRLVVNRLLASIVTDATVPPTARSPMQSLQVTAVRALVRNEARARAVLPVENEALSLAHVATTADGDTGPLQSALKGVAVLVICTGTTAFPTRAWRGGNTPTAVDDRGVRNLVEAVDREAIKRVVLLSSIGTHRSSQFPFAILNAFGTVDAKRRGELHVQRASLRYGFSYAIVRPGRLVGAPHTNIGMMQKEPHPHMLDVEIARGDSLFGDLSRSAAADAVLISTKWDTSADLDVSLVHRRGPTPVIERWENQLKRLQTKRPIG